MPTTYLWELSPCGVYRDDHLDRDGYHTIVAIGPDHRERARVRVYSSGDEARVARDLRRWIKSPHCPPPAFVVESLLEQNLHHRLALDM